MKKRTIRELLTVLLLMIITINVSAQRPDLRAMSGEVYYWFNVKLSNSIDRDTKMDAYALRVISPTIYHGNPRAFQKALWEGTAKGTRIAIGPFNTLDETKAALQLYRTLKDTTSVQTKEGSLSWFLVDVTIMERSHSYQFERIPARVAFGSSREFKAALKESLTFKKLAIGPFYDNVQAEISKSLYRVEE
ncbi:MAG: hypothetical protein J5595_09085 [Bacteroidales bacterium]|nr:hypothetical protein [Bacteroidales bacterium]